jgi:hypothetical protein
MGGALKLFNQNLAKWLQPFISMSHTSCCVQSLQENRSLATKPFRRTKVSISSLDVPGDEIVH